MANGTFKNDMRTREAGIIKLFGVVTLGTSGAVSSSSCKGFSIAKTGSEVGRYTVTLDEYYFALLGVSAMVATASADGAYTAAKGAIPILRNAGISASDKSFHLQFIDPATSADAEVENSAKVFIEITLKNSSAY